MIGVGCFFAEGSGRGVVELEQKERTERQMTFQRQGIESRLESVERREVTGSVQSDRGERWYRRMTLRNE